MKILTVNRGSTFTLLTGALSNTMRLNAGERYIVSDGIMAEMLKKSPELIHEYSDLAPYLPRSMGHPAEWRGKRILFYRGRGIGDELILTAIVRFFTNIIGAQCYVACNATEADVWNENYNICGLPLVLPIHLDGIYRARGRSFFHAALFLEHVSEMDSDGEQENVYDRIYQMLGIDPVAVSPVHKRPYIDLSANDNAQLANYMGLLKKAYPMLDLSKGYILYQVSPTHVIRALPPIKAIECLEALRSVKLPVLAIDNSELFGPVADYVSSAPHVFELGGRVPTLRILFNLVANSRLCVGPDSLLIHAAAAFGIPSISFWGAYSPDSRAKYYPQNLSVWHKEYCHNSPCFHHAEGFPVGKCPSGPHPTCCECFKGINQDEILQALHHFGFIHPKQ